MPNTTARPRATNNTSRDDEDERAEEIEVREARNDAVQRTRERQSARRYMDYADREGQHATRAFIRSLNEAASGLVPRAWVRPGAVLRAWFDMLSLTVDVQRAAWDEITQVFNEDMQRAARPTRSDERVDIDREWENERERIGR